MAFSPERNPLLEFTTDELRRWLGDIYRQCDRLQPGGCLTREAAENSIEWLRLWQRRAEAELRRREAESAAVYVHVDPHERARIEVARAMG